MSLLAAHNVRKSFGAHVVLDDVSLAIEPNERVALVGNNGSGKSTLAKILGRVEVPDQGRVISSREARISYLPQVPALDPNATAFEVVASGLSEWQHVRQQLDAVTQELGGDPDQTREDETASLLQRQAQLQGDLERLGGWEQEHRVYALLEHLCVPDARASVHQLSGGEQRRIALARLLISEPDLAILDEPTNHLDTDSIEWLEKYLLDSFKGAFLLITHDRYFLDRLVTRTLELEQGRVYSYQGGWQAYLSAKAERQALTERTSANRQNFLRRELEWLRRQPKARGTKQKARISRVEQVSAEAGRSTDQGLRLGAVSLRQGQEVLELRDVSLRLGERTLLQDLNLILQRGQRLGVIGRNGVGKTSLLKLITNSLQPTSGEVRLGKNTQVAYFDQMRSGLDPERTIADNVAGKQDRITLGDQQLTIYSYLERFLFRSEDVRKPVGMLSGGERARVALAKLLLQPTNLLILDEPTNDLDVGALAALEDLLQSFSGSAVLVTHDRYFLNRVATHILAIEGEGRVTLYVGNYDTYLALRPASRPSSTGSDARAAAARKETPAQRSTKARPAKLSYKERLELEAIEPKIEQLEVQLQQWQEQLADPEIYKEGGSQVIELQGSIESGQLELERLMDRWAELESRREASSEAG